jgi:hypothetical protein
VNQLPLFGTQAIFPPRERYVPAPRTNFSSILSYEQILWLDGRDLADQKVRIALQSPFCSAIVRTIQTSRRYIPAWTVPLIRNSANPDEKRQLSMNDSERTAFKIQH